MSVHSDARPAARRARWRGEARLRPLEAHPTLNCASVELFDMVTQGGNGCGDYSTGWGVGEGSEGVFLARYRLVSPPAVLSW